MVSAHIQPKEATMTNQNNIISETFRQDGTLATRLIKDGYKLRLFQYDRDGQVVFCQDLDNRSFNPTDITYNDGCVASITRHDILSDGRTVSQYDALGHVITSVELNKDDIVNFSPAGYIKSIVKHIHRYPSGGPVVEIEEMQFNDNGYIVSSTHKVKMTRFFESGEEKWMTVDAKQYYPDGKLLTHITYKQKTAHTGGISSNNQEDEAASYISSITQYSETGKVQITAQLGEYDEISFNGEKVACITKRVKKSDGTLDIMSQTTYYTSGNICTVTNFKDGKVISSVTYDETGKPQSSTQQGNEQYQDIFANTKNKRTFEKAMAKASQMTVQQAAQILGVSLTITEKELKKIYRKLSMQWHPDRNPGNEEQATRMMQLINEAYGVMCEYLRKKTDTNTNNNWNNPNNNWNHPNNNGNQNNQNNNQTAAEQAWQKLQKAIMDYENAKFNYEQAQRDSDDALKKMSDAYWKMHKHRVKETIDFYHKMCELHDKAKKIEYEAWNRMFQARQHMCDCEREYKRIMNTYKSTFSGKCYEYQRAA